jgi:transmembrane sensor
MPDSHDIDPLILDRYLAGAASAAEVALVAQWEAASSRNHASLIALRQEFAEQGGVRASSTDAAWTALQSRMSANDRGANGRRGNGSKHRMNSKMRYMWRIAAFVVLAAGGGAIWRVQSSDTVLSAPSGQRLSTVLPDGSQMTLAAGSQARWSRKFGSSVREIRLQGEATFDVVHDTTRPFRVRIGDNVAEDVGTRFVVRAWPETGGTEVAVEEGAVALSRNLQEPTLLNAGDRGRIASDGHVDITRDGAVRAAWARGEFVFDNTALAEALPALARWYGVTITAPPSMSERRVNGRFNLLPIDPLLESLALALDARIERNGSAITLSPR